MALSITTAAQAQRFEDVDWMDVLETGFRKAPEIFAKLRVIFFLKTLKSTKLSTCF